MWTDNETKDDYLGFKVHSDLIREVVTDPSLLPVVVGVFGDWGGGKSSIMRMLESDLENQDDVACLYFNGWMFEGYEDAKTALLTSILLALKENKRFGPEVKDRVGALLMRVKWMDLGRLAIQHVGVPLAIGAATGGIGTIPAVLGSLAASTMHNAAAKAATGNLPNASAILAEEESGPELLEVRKFRDDFGKMLADSSIGCLVIIIDDLDRCVPERIIDTLEAIKLFVAVEHTAFVIGADQRIVEHAIATRYARVQADAGVAEYSLTKDYLEKLIQIPYHLPRLSPAEMEGYINLLLCQKHLDGDALKVVVERWTKKRAQNIYAPFGLGDVLDCLGSTALPQELTLQLEWCALAAGPLTEGLKGNPRQVKRMLNAMQLRQKLSRVANLEVRPEVLAKLMVLEYTRDDLFRELDSWQTAAEGHPPQVQSLENAAIEGKPVEGLGNWDSQMIRRWLTMEPFLVGVDLRDYFWIARDRTKSTLSEASLVPPVVNALYRRLMSGNEGEQALVVTEALKLEPGEAGHLLKLLQKQLVVNPGEAVAFDALKMLVVAGLGGAEDSIIQGLGNAPVKDLLPSTVQNFADLVTSQGHLRAPIMKVLRRIADSDGAAAAAAKISLEDLSADGGN